METKIMNTHKLCCWLCCLLGLSLLIATAQGESLPAGLKVVSVEAHPQQIELKDRFDYCQLMLVGKLESGEIVDLTRLAKLQQTGTAANISATGIVAAAANGQSELTYTFEQFTVKVPVKVAGIEASRTVSFLQDVQPVLSKMGCNQGTCHGAKDGKFGFKLSLRGYDPLYDHRALTDDIGARRFNRAAPDQSLFLLKGTGSIAHQGGVRMQFNDSYYSILREWISQGVKLDIEKPRVTKIDLWPKDPILPRADMSQQFQVIATYADGKTRDVTREAFVESGNIEVLESKPNGTVTTLRRGEAPVLVRYEGAYAATTIIVMGDRTGFQWQQPATHNYIDELVYQKLQRVKVSPSELCTDSEFVRRLYLDLTGLPPTADQVREFLADARESHIKREALIDQLVGGHEFVEYWTNKWADMLQVNRKFLGEEGSIALRNWIKQAIASNKPYDQFAREVLTAQGSNLENPPAAYYKILREPEATMENTTHLFLAVRFNCNKCHDHPFERWTQDQYYHMSAYFAQIGRKEDPNFVGQKIGGSAVEGAAPLVEVIYDKNSGEVTHNRTGKQSPPAFPYQAELVTGANNSRRDMLAQWMTSPQNQYFAKSYVNRMWGYLLGTGIIEPIDDIRAGNPPTNPELLDTLTRDFIEHGFDVQHLMKQICKSRVYQHAVTSNRWNEDDVINYSHNIPRRLPAEVLFDSIHVATGSMLKLNGAPVGFRAAELPDAGASDPFLDDFGRPVRESSCECERSSGMVLGPIMKLVNGPTVSNAIADPNNALSKLVATEPNDAKVIREVFVRFLGREASAEEIKLGVEAMQAAAGDHTALVAKLAAHEQQLVAQQAAWEKTLSQPVVWTPVEMSDMKSAAGASFTKQAGGSILVGDKLQKDIYTLNATVDAVGITGIKLEALTHESLSSKGPGRAPNGNFVLSELKFNIAPKEKPTMQEAVALQGAVADFNQDSFPAAAAVDGRDDTGWAVSPQFGKEHALIASTKSPVGLPGGSIVTFTLSHQYADGLHNLGHFRISLTTAANPQGGNTLPAPVAAALAVEAAKRSPAELQTIAQYYRAQDSELARLQAELQKSEAAQVNKRLYGVQDLAWALINSPAFLFNH
jgi:Protein of unknown function (DUF1553)/Protein of unknown function (DUF1549)